MFRRNEHVSAVHHANRFTKMVVNGQRIIRRTNGPYHRSSTIHRPKKLMDLISAQTLDKKKLDALSLAELQQLKNLIEEKQEEKRTQVQPSFARPEKLYSLEKYCPREMGLKEYTGDARDPKTRLRDKMTRPHEKIFLHREDLMKTDLIFKYRLYLDSLSRQQNQDLIGARIFSISNSPSLEFTLATIDETCIFLKYHDLYNLPINPNDLFFYTATIMKYSFFAKLNLTKLTCIFNDSGDGEKEYRIFRKLSGKPVTENDRTYIDDELQRRSPASFNQPIQQAMSLVMNFTHIAKKIKQDSFRATEPLFLKDYDINRTCEFYQCGLITKLVMEQLRSHQCDDLGCQSRVQRSLAPWKSSLFFGVLPERESTTVSAPEVPNEVNLLKITVSDEQRRTRTDERRQVSEKAAITVKCIQRAEQDKQSVSTTNDCGHQSTMYSDTKKDIHTPESEQEEMELDYDEACGTDSYSEDSE